MRRNKLFPTCSRCQAIEIAFLSFIAVSISASSSKADETNDTARFSDKPVPLATNGFPQRPPPLIELGDHFLGNGNIQKGITLPTGEVISPNFWVFGTLRSAVDTFDTGDKGPGGGNSRTSEWANRLDIYGNLQFTPTERLLVGFRPLERQYDEGANGVVDTFSGYRIEPLHSPGQVVNGQGTVSAFGATPRTLFFEGEFGEMFPRLDQHDRLNFDYGFSFGRQPLNLQDGLLANSYDVDMLSVTRTSLQVPGGSTMRISAIGAWSDIQGQNYNVPANVPTCNYPDAHFFGVDSAADFPVSTIEANVLYGTSGNHGDGVYAGLAAIQHFGKLNTTFRAVTSVAVDGDSSTNGISRVATGTLLLSELSYPMPGSKDFIYMDAYWGIDRFTSVVRDSDAGGPLGNVGLLTAAVGLGNYAAPLGDQPDHNAGGALGYQMFIGPRRRQQLVFEIGGRAATRSPQRDESIFGSSAFGGPPPAQAPKYWREESAEGVAVQYQQAVGQRFVLILGGFAVNREDYGGSFGGRMEWVTKF
jgi:hypothetical protein